MKKNVIALGIVAFLFPGLAVAEQQYQNNGTDVGIANKTNVTGCVLTRSGEIATINCQTPQGPITITGNLTVSGAAVFNGTLTGVNWNEFPGGMGASNWQAPGFNQGINWQAIPQGYTSGINWIGADISARGINWQDFHVFATTYGDHSGINWPAIPGS